RTVSIRGDDDVGSIRRPGNYITAHGKPIWKLVDEAMTAGLAVSVDPDPQQTGLVVMTVPTSDGKGEFRFWLDPTKLCYPAKLQKIRDNRVVMEISTTPQRIAQDLWLPAEGRRISYGYPNGQKVVQEQTIMAVRD